MSVFERCLEKCRARKGAVVYSDGEDRRVVSAGRQADPRRPRRTHPHRRPRKDARGAQESGETGVSLQVVNPYNPALLQHNAAEYMSIQKDKGKDISEEEAIKARPRTLSPPVPLWSAAVKPKSALPGTCPPRPTSSAPACAWSAPPPGSKTVSSFFFMLKDNNVCMFTDCAVIPEPTSGALGGHCDQHRRRVQARHGRRGPCGPAFLLHERQRQA